MEIRIKKIHPDAVVPSYATDQAAGFDLVATEDVMIPPGATVLVGTGLAFELPEGYELQIRPRSGISYKTKLRVANAPGTIDADYRGEVKVIIDNISRQFAQTIHTISVLPDPGNPAANEGTYVIHAGDRIAQGVIAPVKRASFQVVEELGSTIRGGGGFGHTGTKA